MRSRSGSSLAPLRPAAAAIRPQFGSAPWTAAFTRFEPATARATSRASRSSRAPFTLTSIRCRAPSPSPAICSVSERQTASSASRKATRDDPPARGRPPAAPLARIMTVSFVDGSPSTVTWLKVRSTVSRSAVRSVVGSRGASVVRKASIVPICGWIIPEPFAVPPIRAVRSPPRSNSAAASFGRVSVVMIARATARSALRPVVGSSFGRTDAIWSTPSREPMSPVDAVRT